MLTGRRWENRDGAKLQRKELKCELISKKARVGVKNMKAKTGQRDLSGIDRDTHCTVVGIKDYRPHPLHELQATLTILVNAMIHATRLYSHKTFKEPATLNIHQLFSVSPHLNL